MYLCIPEYFHHNLIDNYLTPICARQPAPLLVTPICARQPAPLLVTQICARQPAPLLVTPSCARQPAALLASLKKLAQSVDDVTLPRRDVIHRLSAGLPRMQQRNLACRGQ